MTTATAAKPERRPSLIARLLAAIPPEPALPPVRYSAPLVVYVVAICAVAIAVAAATLQKPSDTMVLVVGAVAIVVLDLVRVRSFGGIQSPWSPVVFVHLALTLAVGPIGALTAAAVGSPATAARLRTGWFRAVFNLADFFLANMAALGTFRFMRHVSGSYLWIILAGGAAIGLVCYLVNHALIAVAVRLSSAVSLRTFVVSVRGVIPYEVACGVGAATFSLYATPGSASALIGWLVLAGALQALIVRLAHGARERVELLQRNITAAETERFKIAADLHDGPVAALAGIAMSLGDGEDADELRRVQRELRDLIFNYTPHDLDKQGRLRQEITDKQLAALRERGVDVEITIPETVPLERRALELVHRVCGEALTNVLRHARASHVVVALTVAGSEVILTIDDDGQGFSAEDVERQRAAGHFGTRFLAEKAEVAGGTFAVQSEPGKGSHVRLNLPIADATAAPGP